MALTRDLAIVANSASGVYFFRYDRSLAPQVANPGGLRLLIGQSKKGPVNRPVLITGGYDEFKGYFGSVDRNLERNGSYFHRSASFMSQGGPFLAMNIRSYDDSLDLVARFKASTSKLVANANDTLPFTSVFDTGKDWFIDPAKIVTEANTQYLNFVNVSEGNRSVFVVKSQENGYDRTVAQYYAQLGREIPSYLEGNELISDYMVDVYLFSGDFSDSGANVTNPAYGSLFTVDGLKKTVVTFIGDVKLGVEQLSKIPAAGFINKYTGCLIPDLTDLSGNALFIGTQINNDIVTGGVICEVNRKIIYDAGDWVYGSSSASNARKKPKPIDLLGHNLVSVDSGEIIGVSASSYSYLSYSHTPVSGTLDYNLLKTVGSKDILTLNNAWFPATETLVSGDYEYKIISKNEFYSLGTVIPNIQVGDLVASHNGNLTRVRNVTFVGLYRDIVDLHTNKLPIQGTNAVFPQDTDGVFIYPPGHPDEGEPVEYDTNTGYPLDGVGGTVIPFPTLSAPQRASVLSSHGTNLNVFKITCDDYVISDDVSDTVTNVGGPDADLKKTLTDSTVLTVYQFADAIIKIVKAVDKQALVTKSITLAPSIPRAAQFVNNTAARQNEILTATLLGSLRGYLTDLDAIEYAYLVDGFKSFIEPGFKSQLTAIVEERQASTALINPPFSKDFENSIDPYFRDSVGGRYNTRFIPSGGNTSLPYSKLFSLPIDGAKQSACYFPNFIIDDSGTDMKMPSAPIVSNNFAQKRITGNVFDGVFGASFGQISSVGIKRLEYALTKADRDNLELFGFNPIVFTTGLGFSIQGNSTLFQVERSAFNFINVAELVNQIQELMRPLMEAMLGKPNIQINRTQLKTDMDDVTRLLAAAGGLSYFENICDETNNTPEVISNGILVADTIIAPAFIATRIVHRTYVYRDSSQITTQIL